MTWTKWADERPTDTNLFYRWSIPARKICGLMLRPEWTGALVSCGMGFGENEWWPRWSHWDGYVRSVDPELEWRPAAKDEIETNWEGLDLLPDPWTGKPPKIETKRLWINAPVYEVEWFGITHQFGRSLGWTNAADMMNQWNNRVSPGSSELDAYDAGLLGDYGGGDVEWWHDYLRAELARAHDFYSSQNSS